MEVIRKQISIEGCRSHKKGLLPFVRFNGPENEGIIFNVSDNINYNFGNFPCDLLIDDNIIKYLDIINEYLYIKKMLKNGLYGYGRIINDNFIFTLCNDTLICDNATFTCKSNSIFDYKPLNSNGFIEINKNVYKSENKDFQEGYYVLLSNYLDVIKHNDYISKKIFNENYEFYDFIKFVEKGLIESPLIENQKLIYKDKSFELITPTIEIPILLEEESIFDSIYYNYEQSYNGTRGEVLINGEKYNGIIDGTVIESTILPISEEKINYSTNIGEIETESRLSQFIDNLAIYIDDEIFGLPIDLNRMYLCTLQDNKWVNIEILSENDVLLKTVQCIDGENFKNEEENIIFYKNIPFLDCIKNFTDLPDGNYYFLVRYKNDKDNPIQIPFKNQEKINYTTYDNGEVSYDYIEYTKNENYVNFMYIIGTTSSGISQHNGLKYEEKLEYLLKTKDTIVDGYEVTLYYEELNYNTNIKTIFNTDYNVSSDIKIAKLKEIPLFDVWRDDLSVNIPIFTKENSVALYTLPKMNMDITFNRGNAAGWEKHFKLSECNTMKDLENYGNNVFNL